jgi:hypothetical protein
MAVDLSGMHLHYRCSFDLTAIDGSAWAEIVKTIRSWIQRVVGEDDQLAKGWFFRGGSWRHSTTQRVSVRVEVAGYDEAEASATYWALRCEHSDREFPFRQWRIDIGITQKGPQLYGFSLILAQGLLPGFFGDEPPVPVPTAPNLVHRFLSSRRWSAVGGAEELTTKPKTIAAGEGPAFAKRLADTARSVPIVYVSRTISDELLFDAKRLAWLLAGAAVVYTPESQTLDEEMEWVLPRPFRAQKGMLRIYAPGVKTQHEPDARRHRFFTADQIRDRTPAVIQDMTVRGIARRAHHLPANQVATVDDVLTQRYQLRIKELKRSSEQQPSSEWVGLLEEVNSSLEQENQTSREQIETLTELTEAAEAENEGLRDENAKLKFEKEQLITWHGEHEATIRQLRDELHVVSSLSQLPNDVAAVAATIEKLHVTTIEFTPEAWRTARDATFAHPEIAWRILWAMATTLHDLYFSNPDERMDIEKRFKELTGFDLALNEGRSTARDRRLMNLRKQEYNGRLIDITSHVKFGNRPPKLLRVHYCPDRERRRIVVGHIGNHMDNFSTTKA